MKYMFVISLSSCLLALISTSALAHKHDQKNERKSKIERMFEGTDTNQDGQLQLSEYLANAEQRFIAMDLNQDGYLTKEEGKMALRDMRKNRKTRVNRDKGADKKNHLSSKMFERADADKDGQVQLSESLSHAEKRFAKMDQNEDGVVTKSEGEEAYQQVREKRNKSRKRKISKMFSSSDTNQDGQLELSEYLAHAEQRFKAMDLNGDGALTKEEGVEAHRLKREKRKAQRQADSATTE
jgi:Ca2+-binding EF-hand superfamily protein